MRPVIHPIGDYLFPKTEELHLSNGIPVNALPFPSSELVRVDILFPAGIVYQPHPFVSGSTHGMMREGTLHHTSKEISELLDFHGCAFTSYSTKRYAGVSIQVMTKYFPQMLELTREMVTEPLFPKEELSIFLSKKKQSFEISESRVANMASRGLIRCLYGEKGTYGTHPSASDYDRITTEELKAFHQKHYPLGHCRMMVYGDVNPQVLATLDQVFGQLPIDRKSPRPTYNYVEYPATEKKLKVTKKGSVQSAVFLGRPMIGYKHPDYFPFTVLNTVLGGYFGSRLMTNIREEKGYTYGINSAVQVYPDSSVLKITTQTDNAHVEPLIKEIHYELNRLCQERIPDEELDIVKNYMLGEMQRSSDGSFSVADAYMALLLEEFEPQQFFAEKARAIREVTQDELQHLAQKYLNPADFYEVVAGDK